MIVVFLKQQKYFGRKETTDPETAARLAKFSGSSSISSADFYERDEGENKESWFFVAEHLRKSGFSNTNNSNGGGDDLAINIAATAKVWICSVCLNLGSDLVFAFFAGRFGKDHANGFCRFVYARVVWTSFLQLSF